MKTCSSGGARHAPIPCSYCLNNYGLNNPATSFWTSDFSVYARCIKHKPEPTRQNPFNIKRVSYEEYVTLKVENMLLGRSKEQVCGS